MHSLKNTAVAVTLLAISFGLYQVSLTPEEVIDPSEIPTLDISDGLPANADSGLSVSAMGSHSSPHGSANPLSMPQLTSTQPPRTQSDSRHLDISLPDLPQLGSSSVAKSAPIPYVKSLAAGDRPTAPRSPVISTTNNNVQTIEYPDRAANRQSTNQFAATAEISQREPVDSARDQGLIDALKNQQNFESGLVANQTTTRPSNQPAASPPSMSANSSFIGANDSSFNRQAANVDASGFGGSSSGGFDPSVRQANVEPGIDDLDFNAAWTKVDELVDAGEFKTALQLLSRFYPDRSLSGPQRQRLLGWLDALASKVIFSEEHHLAPQPYIVNQTETLSSIAAEWKVPEQLILNINRKKLKESATVAPGTPLKMVPGPFHAEISLDAKVMTLFLGDLYAGRFPVRVGISGAPKPGKQSVIVKSQQGHAWRDSKGVDYPPGSPQNGYGPNWIGLTGSLCIHAVADDAIDGHHGCFGLSPKDAQDVFAILSKDSIIVIKAR